jgi:hypothetical protein
VFSSALFSATFSFVTLTNAGKVNEQLCPHNKVVAKCLQLKAVKTNSRDIPTFTGLFQLLGLKTIFHSSSDAIPIKSLFVELGSADIPFSAFFSRDNAP